ncbi:hypothetical protein [uncultured Fibrella sp.]|uniref:hypothetical protein n=1 Tax=uncultured Fibrella sp. TaxID=1284596 RepID=UPI0035CA35AD
MSNTRTFLLLSLLVSQFMSFVSYGQAARRPDEIVRKDNSIIQGLISEINETAIYYRKTTAPQGQQYQVKKSDVRYIKYSNNEIESFEEKAVKPASTARSASTAPANRTRPEPARNVPGPSRAAVPAASSSDPHARFGITAGGGGGFFQSSGTSSDMGVAFRAGITAEIPIGSKIALAPSVEFLQLSQGKSPNTAAFNYAVGTLAIASLYNESKPVNLFYSVGVYGAYGVSVSGGGESVSFDEAKLNAFHAGGDVKLGARFSQALTVYAQGSYGIMPVQSASTVTVQGVKVTIPATTQLTFGVGIRYLFGK